MKNNPKSIRTGVINVTASLPVHPSLRYGFRPLDRILYIVIHHAGVDADPTPEQTARYHVETNGWPGIGYHFAIMRDGTVYQTNWLTTLSYHVSGHNQESVGILLNGDFREGRGPTQAQFQSLFVFLIPELIAQLGDHVEVKAHKELSATSCPGDWWVEE